MLSLILIVASLQVFAKTYYVATNGNDDWPGTKEKPWKTWGKAFNADVINPGDTVFFRGGIYYKDISEGESSWFYPYRDEQGGSGYKVSRYGADSNTMVYYFAYPGEEPILDCDSTEIPAGAAGSFYGIRADNISYCHFKGLTVRNVWAHNSTDYDEVECVGFAISGTGFIVENCKSYNVHGIGFRFYASHDSYVINSDAWNCCDSVYSIGIPGERGTGFSQNNRVDPNSSMQFKHCRAWLCSDQGFSSLDIGYVEYDSCWAFLNGGLGALGSGIKGGLIYDEAEIPLSRKITNNILAFNRYCGLNLNDNNHGDPDGAVSQSMNIFNNTIYHNGHYPWGDRQPSHGIALWRTSSSDSLQLTRVFRNNIAYDDETGPISVQLGALYTHSNNTWDSDVTVTDADFIGPIDSATIMDALLAPRKADGSLPDFPFFQLAEGSKLIDAGTDVGLPFNGDAPDLGVYEYQADSKKNNNYPSVRISSPADRSEFINPVSITIIAEATDDDGSINKVEFFNGNIKLGEKTSSPWSYTWNTIPPGEYIITVKATDNLDSKTTSSPVLVYVKDNTPPSVEITAPINGSEFLYPATIIINTETSDIDGSISKVEFFNGASKLGEKTSAPWSIIWNEVPEGVYNLVVTAFDDLDSKATSSPVSVSVRKNLSPVVEITSPSNGAEFSAPANIFITAEANDPDGSISKVEFFSGENKLGEKTTGACSFTWEDASIGEHIIIVKATDNDESTAISSIYVKISPAINLYPNPNNGIFTLSITEDFQDEYGWIFITSIEGKVVYNGIMQDEPMKLFNLSHIEPGVYVLKLFRDKMLLTKDFVKN